MENEFDVSIQRFNDFAEPYANRFMDIGPYREALDQFCDTRVNCPRILDLACGPGNFTFYLRKRFPKSPILAWDLAPAMIEIARKLLPDVTFRKMDIRDISSLEMKFDMILCSFGLPFLSAGDAEKLVRDCAALLEKGGKLYLSTMEGDEAMAGFETTSFTGKAEIYFNYHRQKDLENYFTKAGFIPTWFKRQEYLEADGTTLQDLIFIAEKA